MVVTREDVSGQEHSLGLDAPSLSKVYDYLLGGGQNFAVDRVVAGRITALVPGYRLYVCDSRAFVRRAMLHMISAGIEQFVDLGTGMPASRRGHHLDLEKHRGVRVVYVDRDPVVLAGLGQLVEQSGLRAGTVRADLRCVDEVLDNAVTARLVDFDRPVGVLAGSVLHCLPDAGEVAATLAGYHERLAPGSLFAASHADGTALGPELAAAVENCFAEAGITVVHRGPGEFADLLGPWQPDAEGVVPVGWWRPDRPALCSPELVLGNAVVAGRQRELGGADSASARRCGTGLWAGCPGLPPLTCPPASPAHPEASRA